MAANLEELLAQYRAKSLEAQAQADEMRSKIGIGTSLATGGLGLVGAIAAPFVAKGIGSLFGLDERSQAEKEAIARIRDVASGGRTAAQSALEYQRARVGQQATQAASMGPARERAARQLVGQEQQLQAQTQVTGRLAEIKAAEQQRASEALAGIETRAGEAERQRQRQLIAGAVTGGLGALSQAYGGYMAGRQRAADLEAQAKGAAAAATSLEGQVKPSAPATTTPVERVTQPMTASAKEALADEAIVPTGAPLLGGPPSVARPLLPVDTLTLDMQQRPPGMLQRAAAGKRKVAR